MINENKTDIEKAKKERIRLRVKDKELENNDRRLEGRLNKILWMGGGFLTCFTMVAGITSTLLMVIWWATGNRAVVDAIMKVRGI
jgi:hypothetical protein